MVVFLPGFSISARESLDDILNTLEAHPIKNAAALWHKLVLVNFARLAAAAVPSGGGKGSMLTFLGGGRIFVQQSPQEIMVIAERDKEAA